MSRATKIKLNLYRNAALASCSPMASFIFPGLKVLGGSGRRVEEHIERIKDELLPLDDDLGVSEVKALINELVHVGMLNRMVEHGRCYLVIQPLGKR